MKKAFVLLSVLCMALVFACQKDQSFPEDHSAPSSITTLPRSYSSATVEHFFDLSYASSLLFSPTGTAESRSDEVHPSILIIQDFLYEENEVNPFIERLVDSIGYPAWDAVRLFDSDKMTIMLIPYIQEGDQDIDNILYAKTEGDALYMKFLNRSLLWDIISDSDGTSTLLSELESDFLYFDNMYFGTGLTDEQASERGGHCTICTGCGIKEGKCVGFENGASCTCATDCAGCRQVEVIDGGGGVGTIIFLHPWWFYPEKTIHNSNSNPNVGPNNNGNNGGGGSSAPPCEAPYEEPSTPNQGGSFNLILDDLFAQLSPGIQNQITGLAGTINISAHSWKWLMRHPEAITAMYNHYQAGGSSADLQAYFDVVSQYTCVLNTDASFEDILKINELMNDEECSMVSNDGGYDLVEVAQLTEHLGDAVCENSSWLIANPIHRQQILNALKKNPNDLLAQEIMIDHLERLTTDDAYKEFVESTMGWSGIMWSIAKELIGDKMVDIIIQFIPGFGQSDEIRDAVKAAKNGDWAEFVIEIGKIVVQNTPWGKLAKVWDISDDVYDFYNKVKKVFDAIGHFTDQVLERVWAIVKRAPASLRTNGEYFKYVGDLETPKFGIASTSSYRTTFDGAFPDLRANTPMQVHHAVPQAVRNNYPRLNIASGEMHSLENLRGIPNDAFHPIGSNVRLHQHLTNQWADFYRQYQDNGTVPSLQDIFTFTKQLDDQFGHRFNPPIR